MDRSDVLTLISETFAEDELHIYRKTEKRRDVFVNVSSVTASEWFEGGRNGLNPQYRFTMFAPDYEGEQICEYTDPYTGKTDLFRIYRTYRRKTDELELYAEKRKGAVDYGEE